MLRARLALDYWDIGDLTPDEMREVLDPYRGGTTALQRRRLLEGVTVDVR